MTLSSHLRRGVVGALATGAGAALVLGTGAVAASAATPSPAPSHAAACTFGQHLRQAWGRMPDQLRTDLKAARAAAPGDARRAAVKKVWTTAESGGYGPAAEARASWIAAQRSAATHGAAEHGAAEHGAVKLRQFPDALKTDLGKLKGETGADRVKTLDGIATKAVAGDCGATLQAFAKRIQSSDAWKDCTPSGS